MANHKAKDWQRLDVNTGKESSQGRLFAGPVLADLSAVQVVWAGVDTIRQLYRGVLKQDVLAQLEEDSESGDVLWSTPLALMWHVSRAPWGSGYTYKLQNNEWGAVVLVKSFYAKAKHEGAHLKIELSPHMIVQRGARQIQQQLDHIAAHFFGEGKYKYGGCAPHLAADVQGWDIRSDFMEKFLTRSRTVRNYNGISKVQFDLSEVSSTYGDNETVMFGKPNALQFTTYRKDKEIQRSDKVDFMRREWECYSMGLYDDSKPVRRFEARFHHSVVAEIGEGIGEELLSFSQVAEHLTDLWRYALQRNRLDYSSQYIDPFWQLLRDDVQFYHPANGLWIRRVKKESVQPVGRNYSQIIGNLVTVAARMGWKTTQLMKELKKLSFFDDILRWYSLRGWNEGMLRQELERSLLSRRLMGKAA